MPIRYLTRAEVADRIGVKPDTLNRYKMPPADAVIGPQEVRGWLPETIDDWNARRPGGGNWANKTWHLPPDHR